MIAQTLKRLSERFGAPAVSVAVHAAVILVLVNMVVFKTLDPGREVQVQVVEVEKVELEQIEQQLEELSPDETLCTSEEEFVDPPGAPPDEFADDTPDLEGLSVSTVQSPLVMKGLFAGRTEGARQKQLAQFAGEYAQRVEEAVRRGLDWLKKQQHADGRWGAEWKSKIENDQRAVRLTALGLLAFLAHGETPQSPEYGETVRRAIEYLLRRQNAETGLFVPLAEKRPERGGEDLGVYAHAQAVYALAEAYALTRAPALKAPVERGLAVIIKGQLDNGAWSNWYEQPIADSSATSWQVQALKAAQAAGIRMNGLEAAMMRAGEGIAYLYKGEGVWYYRKGGVIKTWRDGGPVMSGAMVLSLQLLGLQNDAMVNDGLRYLTGFGVTDWDTAWENPINKSLPATYEWYYNTQAVFQRGGSRWKTWNADFAPMLLDHQHEEGWWLGLGQDTEEEKLYSTSLCTLALQVYYRILPTFQHAEAREPGVTFDDDVMIEIL